MHQHLGEAEAIQAEATEDFGEWAALENALPSGAADLSAQTGSQAGLI